MEQTYSNAVNILGVDEVVNAFNFIRTKNLPLLPIISVGSGNGKLETELDRLLHRDIICVEHRKQINTIKAPLFKYVSDMETTKYHNKCILFLNWSDDSGFDIEAVKLLEPLHIIIISDLGVYGSSSSLKMHQFMFDFGVDTDGHKTFTGPGVFVENPNNKLDFIPDTYSLKYSKHKNQWVKGYEHPIALAVVVMSTPIKQSWETFKSEQTIKMQKVRSFERLERARKSGRKSCSPRNTTKKNINNILVTSYSSQADDDADDSPVFIPDEHTLEILKNHKLENIIKTRVF